MAEVDTSMYKLPVRKSPLEMAGQLQSLESSQLGIDSKKLEQAKFGLEGLLRDAASIGPKGTPEQFAAMGRNAVKMGYVPASALPAWDEKIASFKGNMPEFYRSIVSQATNHAEALASHIGTAKDVDTGAGVISGRARPIMEGGGMEPGVGSYARKELPPTTPTVDNQRLLPDGTPNPAYLQPGYLGPAGPAGVSRLEPTAGAGASVASLPTRVAPSGPASPAAAQPRAAALPPSALPVKLPVTRTPNFTERFAGETRVSSGASPGVAGAIEAVGTQSGKDYATDLTRAKSFKADLYPAEAALAGIQELGPKNVGPGTEPLNAIKSAIVTWLPNVDKKIIDEVGTFEQTRKYLTQIARSSGSTGTNDQLAASFEANPSIKMSSAATENVLKSVIALRKMQHAQTLLFGQQNLPPSDYSSWISKNQNTLDARAFGFDMMTPEAKTKLIASLKKDPKAYQKFETSLQFAHDADLITPPARK